MVPKILIADDESHIRLLLEQTLEDLEDEGVLLLFAENGRVALDMIREESPQLVFLDVMMPLMNGMAVCTTVKNEWEMKDTYIVLLTAKGQETDRHEGDAAGTDLYLTKPFDPDQIIRIARNVLLLPA